MDGAALALDPALALGRSLRAPMFAGATLALGIGAHLAAGGTGPEASLTCGLFVMLTLLWLAVGRRQVSLGGLVVGLFATQVGIHVALLGGHHHGGTGTSPAMLAAHLVAGSAMAALLHRHEIACWRAWICCRLTADIRLVVAERPGARLTDLVADRPALPRSLVTLVTDPLRGPPHLA